MNIGSPRLRQDLRYVFQGFIASLVIISLVGLLLAAITLILLAIAPGSIGEALRTLIPPDQLMAWMLVGAIGAIAVLWFLARFDLLPQRLSLRLRWGVGVMTGGAMLLSVILSAILG